MWYLRIVFGVAVLAMVLVASRTAWMPWVHRGRRVLGALSTKLRKRFRRGYVFYVGDEMFRSPRRKVVGAEIRKAANRGDGRVTLMQEMAAGWYRPVYDTQPIDLDDEPRFQLRVPFYGGYGERAGGGYDGPYSSRAGSRYDAPYDSEYGYYGE